MKNKKLMLVTSALATMALITGCNNQPATSSISSNDSGTSTSSSAPTSSSTTPSTPSSSTPDSSSSSSTSSSSEPEVIVADETYATTLPEGSITRNYNSTFDKLVDDFSGDTAKGTVTTPAVFNANPYLKVRLNSANAVFPTSADASIYKQGEGTYPIAGQDGIGFKIRIHAGEKTITNDKLILGLRGDDACQLYELPLNVALDPDGGAMPTLSGDYQDFVISPSQSIPDENTVYKNKDGSASSIKVLSTIVGIHLYAKGEMCTTLDIAEVYLTKGGNKTIIEDFKHEKVNDGGTNLWWRDSTGTIIGKEAEVDGGGAYEVATSDTLDNIVVNACGVSTGTSVVFSDGTNTVTKTWAELKDGSEKVVPALLHDTLEPIVINLAKSGVSFAPTSVKFVSTTAIRINKIFFSNLETKSPAPYAAIDADKDDIKVFDSFNRTQSGFNGDYDASHSNQIIKDAGLDYALSYNADTASMVSIDGKAVIFDATSLDANGYINFKEGSDAHARSHEKYLVMSMKLTDGATLDNFRMKVSDTTQIIYANQWYASSLTKSLETPYAKTDDYSWYVIDLAESGIDTAINYLDMYYSGAGKLAIDEIFFTDSYSNALTLQNADLISGLDEKTLDTTGGYSYIGGGVLTSDTKVVGLSLKGDGSATLESLRLELNGTTLWFKDDVIKDVKGNVIKGSDVLPSEMTTIYIDLSASGFVVGGNLTLHIHGGGLDGCTGTISFGKLASYTFAKHEVERITEAKTVDTSGYSYVGWVGNGAAINSAGKKYLSLTLSGDGTATLASFRLADGSEFWVKDDKIILADGSTLDKTHVISSEGETFVIDLEKTGLNTKSPDIHAHIGGEGYTGTLVISSMKLVLEVASYSDIYAGHYSD